MNNSNEFVNATNVVKNLNQKPTNEEMSLLYGWYKQATVGNINIEKPGFLDFKGQAKYDSWNKCKGIDKYNSEVNYIKTVNILINKYGIKN